MKTCLTILVLVILSVTATFGQVTILWDESVNGEISGDAPPYTSFGALQLGTNSVIGATEIESIGQNWLVHPDDFTFEVSNGMEVTALYIQIDTPNVWAWIGGPNMSGTLAYTLDASTGDLLSQWGLESLEEGDYGMYLSNTYHPLDYNVANFHLDFVVEYVPEPGTLCLLLVGAGVFTLRHWRKSRFLP